MSVQSGESAVLKVDGTVTETNITSQLTVVITPTHAPALEQSYSLLLQANLLDIESTDDNLPTSFAFHQNYPNPFNPSTKLEFDLPKQIDVSLKVYDIMGREITTIINETMDPGYHRRVWNGRNNIGQQLPSGIYIARLVTQEYGKSIKMVLLK